jgi:hypothetical protein
MTPLGLEGKSMVPEVKKSLASKGKCPAVVPVLTLIPSLVSFD